MAEIGYFMFGWGQYSRSTGSTDLGHDFEYDSSTEPAFVKKTNVDI